MFNTEIDVTQLHWQELPPLPQSLAGQFVGTCDNKLMVIGGTLWTAPPWSGGEKVWTDRVYYLQKGESSWRDAGRMPLPLSYGACVSAQGSVICIGGQTSSAASSKVFRMRIVDKRLEVTSLPDLPQPATMIGATLVGKTIYVVGGQSSPASQEAMNILWALDLAARDEEQTGWVSLEPCPGPPRILPVTVNHNDAFYLFSGAELKRSDTRTPTRRYLSDAYRFRLGEGWRRLKDLPQPFVAAPALCVSDSIVLVFGGDDGENAHRVAELKEGHPGFSLTNYSYNPDTDKWTQVGGLPVSLVTTGVTVWDGKIVVAGGEDRPGSRSPRVIAAEI